MSRWISTVTQSGTALLARISGKRFVFTKVQCGSGQVPQAQLAAQVVVAGYKKDLAITASTNTDNIIKLRAQLTNNALNSGFNLYQVGVFAKLDTDSNDVLFMIIQATTPDYIPSVTENPTYVNDYIINTVIGNASAVSGGIDAAAYVTVGQLESSLATVISSADTTKSALETHIGNKQNPHNVTKAAVGLSNVDDISNANQTSDFISAAIRSNIATGEKLSVIFGKLQKWYADLKDAAWTGIAESAKKLTIARTITLTEDASGSASFDGSVNISIPVVIANDSHTHDNMYFTKAEVDAAFAKTNANVTANSAAIVAIPNNPLTMTAPLIAGGVQDLAVKQLRNMTISTADPSGGSNGDMWFKYS